MSMAKCHTHIYIYMYDGPLRTIYIYTCSILFIKSQPKVSVHPLLGCETLTHPFSSAKMPKRCIFVSMTRCEALQGGDASREGMTPAVAHKVILKTQAVEAMAYSQLQ